MRPTSPNVETFAHDPYKTSAYSDEIWAFRSVPIKSYGYFTIMSSAEIFVISA